MQNMTQGSFFSRAWKLGRAFARLRIGLYASSACFFMVLAVFPALIMLLGLLRYTPLEVEYLAELLRGVLPQPFLAPAEELILITYDNLSGTALSVSAVTTLWSASRGVYGLMTGLNGVYGLRDERNYFLRRTVSLGYTLAFLVLLLMALALHILGASANRLNRFVLLLGALTALFAALYVLLPWGKRSLGESLPGALLAAFGWLIFSDLYSIYMEHYAPLTNVYGSVYALALGMLWLYFCIGIVFCGGALNRLLKEGKL